jgi:L-arabinose isomerase
LRIGLAGFGLEAYWEQFEGLEARLLGYLSEVEGKIAGPAREVFNLGLVDSPWKALDAGHACRRNDIDILFLYVTTYALSSTVLPVIRRANVPVLLLNLQPAPAIDYASFNRMDDRAAMTGEWLAYCSSCPVPEIANVLKRLDIPFQQATGTLHDDPACWRGIEEWLRAAEVVHALSHARLGLLGHYYSGMLDIATDLAQVSGRFGIHIEQLEADELSALRRAAPEAEIAAKLHAFQSFFEVGGDCSAFELERAARTAAALDAFVRRYDLDMMAYYHKGSGVAENEDTMSSIILGTSMLTGTGVPVAGEYEVKNVIAMKILDLLGAGGSFTEYYAMDFAADLVLMGHEMSVKHGPVTLLSVVEDRQRGFMLLVAEGESVAGDILEIGNTNSRYRFPLGARGFVERWNSFGPAHHCAVGVGHLAGQLEKVGSLMKLGFAKVC